MNSFGFGGSNTHAILDDAVNYLRERDLTRRSCATGLGELKTPSKASTALGNGTARGSADKAHTNEKDFWQGLRPVRKQLSVSFKIMIRFNKNMSRDAPRG